MNYKRKKKLLMEVVLLMINSEYFKKNQSSRSASTIISAENSLYICYIYVYKREYQSEPLYWSQFPQLSKLSGQKNATLTVHFLKQLLFT